MDRHAATRRLRRLAEVAGMRIARPHAHMLRHTFTTMPGAGVDLRDVQIAARHADPRTTMRYDRARKNLDRHPTTFSPLTWPLAPDQLSSMKRDRSNVSVCVIFGWGGGTELARAK
jgi:integrase